MHANSAKTHCVRGHEFTPENTKVRANGARDCRACIRERGRVQKRRARQKTRKLTPLEAWAHRQPWPLERRIEGKIAKRDDGCWMWLGQVSKSGYGAIEMKVDGKHRDRMIHRVMYEHLVGAIPDGLVLDHTCANKLCVNPEHLEPVTPSENSKRGTHGRPILIRTHCARGHSYDLHSKLEQRGDGRVSRKCMLCAKVSKKLSDRRLREQSLREQTALMEAG